MSPPDAVSKRRWRIFMAVEGFLLLAAAGCVVAAIHLGIRAKWLIVPATLLGLWLTWTLPVCVLYLIGHPPVMTLSPLIPSAASRAIRRELKARPVLTDDEFYDRFYGSTGVPKLIAIRVRRCLKKIDAQGDRVVPGDYLPLLDDELDMADILHRIGRELGVRFTRADYPSVDGTLDNLVRLAHARLCQATESP